MSDNSVQRPVYLPEDLDEQLGQHACGQGVDENELIRQAVQSMLNCRPLSRESSEISSDTLVMRTVYFSRKIDDQLNQLADELEEESNSLICRAVRRLV